MIVGSSKVSGINFRLTRHSNAWILSLWGRLQTPMMGGNLPKMTLVRFNMGWWRCLSKPWLEHNMMLLMIKYKKNHIQLTETFLLSEMIHQFNPTELPCPQIIWKMWILQSIHSYIMFALLMVFLFTSRSRRDHIHPTYSSYRTSSWNPLQINNHDSIGNKLI